MSPVFSHRRLRQYLLKLLEESPRPRLRRDPAAGGPLHGPVRPLPGHPSYPRLRRLEAEGLVTQSQEGEAQVYRITDAGREELASRRDELDELEREIAGSVHGLATRSDEVRGTVRDLEAGAEAGGAGVRREQRSENRSRHRDPRPRPSLGLVDEGLDGRWATSWTRPTGAAAGAADRGPGARGCAPSSTTRSGASARPSRAPATDPTH